jgi:F-type H+-transporting ATPase subunit gamma
MAKARAIVKRRKAVRNIRKITKTMQMIATAKFQKALKRAVGTKPFTLKVRELVSELAATVGNVKHPLLRKLDETGLTNRVALVVITANRGLAGAYNGNVLRMANNFLRQQEAAGKTVDLYVVGKKGIAYFNYQKRAIRQKIERNIDNPTFAEVERPANEFMREFAEGEIDGVYVAYMNFISTGVQRPEVLQLLPLAGLSQTLDLIAQQAAEKDAQVARGALSTAAPDTAVVAPAAGAARKAGPGALVAQTIYDFSPSAEELLNHLLPLTVKTALYQCFLDAVTSENVARMVSMKSATDNADKMVKSLTMEYNRARQSQITTELSEIMGGVEAMAK